MEKNNKAKIKNLKLFDLLQTLIYADELDRIKLLTELHINLINQVDKNGQTALHYSTLKGRENITILLLEKMSQQTINKVYNFNRAALHYAIINGNKDIIILLLKKMTSDAINQVDNWRKTSLHYAVINNNEHISEFLISKMTSKSINQATTSRKTALHYAVINKNEDIAELLLPKMTIKSITQRSISGKTVLHYASKLNCKYFIKLLLEKGVEIINQFDNNGWTALHTALYNREVKKDLIELLLKNGANTKLLDNKGKTVLHIAIDNNIQIDIVELLLKNGADINYRSESGLTLLHYAVLSCNKDIIKLLLKAMSLDSLNQTAEGGHTVLHYAIGIMRQDIIELLLDSRVDINKASNDIIPLLPYSIQTGRKDIVELFLDKMSLDLINQVDSSGKKGLQLAAILNKQDIVKFLIDSGKCDVTIIDKMGNHIFSSYSMGHVYNREMKDLLMKYSLQDTENDNKSLENTTNYYKTENYCIFQSLYKDMETIYELPEENNSPTSLGLVITDIEQT